MKDLMTVGAPVQSELLITLAECSGPATEPSCRQAP
jgi:hypothetical protein